LRCAGEATVEREGSGGLADSRRAHIGPVAAVQAHAGRVWTSGGDARAAALAEWSTEGEGRTVFPLGVLGARLHLRT